MLDPGAWHSDSIFLYITKRSPQEDFKLFNANAKWECLVRWSFWLDHFMMPSLLVIICCCITIIKFNGLKQQCGFVFLIPHNSVGWVGSSGWFFCSLWCQLGLWSFGGSRRPACPRWLTHLSGILVRVAGRLSSAGMLRGVVSSLSPHGLRAPLPPAPHVVSPTEEPDFFPWWLSPPPNVQCRSCRTFSRLRLRTGSASLNSIG